MGQEGNATPFHNDQWHGLLFQISGHKLYTLVQPFDAKTLQRESPQLRSTTSSARRSCRGRAELANLEMCYQGVLSPGEVLYVPPYWMHQVVTLDDRNVAMPIRFDTTQSPDM